MRMVFLNQARYKELIEKIDTVIIPIGTIETHGEHLPVGTDILIPEGLVTKIEEKMGEKVLVAPTVNYGHVWTLGAFSGSINVSSKILSEYISEIGKAFVAEGLKNIVLLNGHGGNIPALTIASEMIADVDSEVQVITFNWWLDFRQEILEVCQSQGHAGEDETSAMLALAEPHCDMSLARVNNNRLIANIKRQNIGLLSYQYGLSGDATKGTKVKGEKILDVVAQRIMGILEQIWQGEIIK